MNIWLIDATTYKHRIVRELYIQKKIYFRIKAHVKNLRIGYHEPPGQRCYSAGLLRVATILSYSGYSVKYISLEQAKRLTRNLCAYEVPDVVGFGAVCPTIPACAKLAKLFKDFSSDIRILLGGPHARVARYIIKKRYPIFDEIIEDYDIVAVSKLVHTSPTELLIPPFHLDYKLLSNPLNEYCINLFTVIGCKYKCSYCQDRLNVYAETMLDGGITEIIPLLKRRTLIHFSDSTLGGTPARALEVCKALSLINHSFLLSCDLRPEFISKDLINNLVNAGFTEVRIGLESGDTSIHQKTLRYSSPDKVINCIKLIRNLSDLYISIYIVTGLPGSNRENSKSTRNLVKHLIESKFVDEIKHHIYVPYPVDDHQLNPSEVTITEEDWSKYDRQSFPVYNLPNLLAEEIWQEFLRMEKEINLSWAKAFGFMTYKEIPSISYPEYNVACYISNNKK